MFKKVDDKTVRMVYTYHESCLRECGKKFTEEKRVPPSFFSENGNPICEECGCEMEYAYTEVNQRRKDEEASL